MTASPLRVCAGLFAAALLLAPLARAEDAPPPVPPPAETTPVAPVEPPVAQPPPAPGPKLIQAGVTIGGLLVGGLTPAEARLLVTERFHVPVTLIVGKRKLRVTPRELGASAFVGDAVKLAARVKRPGFRVPLKVDVADAKLQGYLARLSGETDRAPVDARLRLLAFRPRATKAVPGRRLKQVVAFHELKLLLRKHERGAYVVPYDELRPTVTEQDLGQVIVIRRESKQLQLYVGTKLKRTFRVATGQSSYPTPIGSFEIVNKQRNPWWYPPAGSDWAADAKPIPPGSGNPLGTRWMGISSPYVGIHGTPDAASIGYSASHGCIRMLIPQVEWLFERVEVGTPVFIVRA